MKIVVIDSSMAGASGDKILSAFVDLGEERLKLEMEKLITNAIGDKLFYFDKKESYGFTGIKAINKLADVKYENLMETLENFSNKFQLGNWGRKFVNEVASIILDIEREIHGKEDLHDLKELDFILEIVCTAKAIEILGIHDAQFFTTPIKIGVGWTKCGHGIIPLPAPATLSIVKKFSIPIFLSNENEEFTTPTGAAIIAALTRGKTSPPIFSVSSMGIGIGERDLGMPNITRIIIGSSEETINVLECNIDDISGEILGWFEEKLRGKVEDVCFLPVFMKKGRSGYMVRVVVKPENLRNIIEVIMRELGSWGVKIYTCNRVRVEKEILEDFVKIRGKEYKIR
ncbi:MAG: DUF111 family protein, partial [Candidatus Methanomethyliaceae archaeon]|nr:DUF111 family protein [Candidatus Methanomethyliaceae archaeon]